MAAAAEPPEKAFTADDVDLAERRAAAARERAAHAGLSAARSIEESARHHEHIAKVQDVTVAQGVSHPNVHRESALRHRQAAADDRKLAEEKRRESEADLSLDTDR
jgi:hypothetical protein